MSRRVESKSRDIPFQILHDGTIFVRDGKDDFDVAEQDRLDTRIRV